MRSFRHGGSLAWHTALVALCAIMLSPLAWMWSISLKQSGVMLSRDIEWLPWQDSQRVAGETRPVLVLSARVRDVTSGERHEVGIRALANRNETTTVYFPERNIQARIESYRVRPLTDSPGLAKAEWVDATTVHRVIAPQWHNYTNALRMMRFTDRFNNTFAVTCLGTIGTVLSCSIVAYGFARFRFPARDALFIVMLSTLMLPPAVTMIPLYLIFRELRWIDTLLPLFVPAWFATSSFSIFLFRQYFLTLPHELDDAAKIDGCNALRTYWHVLLPQARPVVATVALISFTTYWLDFLTPLIYLNSPNKGTLALGLYVFKTVHLTDWHYLMAATLVVSLPCAVLFFAGQRFFVQGVAMTGLKE